MSDLHTSDKSSTENLKEKLTEAGAEIKQRTSEALDMSSDVAREKLGELSDAARDVASHAAEHVQEQVGAQQEVGADYIGRFAGDMRTSAKAFERDAPFAAHGLEVAAGYVEDAAQKMRDGSIRDLVDGATSFARRQPAAFLGLSVLAGFAAVRFLKSGSEGYDIGPSEAKGAGEEQRRL
jgi:hypothetical protein